MSFKQKSCAFWDVTKYPIRGSISQRDRCKDLVISSRDPPKNFNNFFNLL